MVIGDDDLEARAGEYLFSPTGFRQLAAFEDNLQICHTDGRGRVRENF